MECQKLLSREAWEEVGIKGKRVSLGAAALLSAPIVCEVTKGNFAQMRVFPNSFFNTVLTRARSARDELGCRSFLLLTESGVPRFIYWLLSGRTKGFVLLIILFVATGNQKGMPTVHWRKVN